MHIRLATELDRNPICDIHLQAFPEAENQLIAELSDQLLSEKSHPPSISMVAENEDSVVGHVAFSPVKADKDKDFLGYILAPLAVKPKHQKRGIGALLVKTGLEKVAEFNTSIVIVYGDPNYYGRFGFTAEAAQPYLPPYKLQYPFGWQALAMENSQIASTPLQLTCVSPLSNPDLW